MLELLQLLDTSYRTISLEMDRWFAAYPSDIAWNVFSDYCIGDKNKANDAFSFAVVLNHDRQANISEYIAAVAPSDLKKSRSPSVGLISYLRSPVVFSVSYVVERSSKLLRDYATDDNIISELAGMRELVGLTIASSMETASYYRAVDKRLASFEMAMKRPGRNSHLARQIFLCAGFAAVLLRTLDNTKRPKFVRWISDRDPMFDQHDQVAFDLAKLYFDLLRQAGGTARFHPEFTFGLPGWDGVNQYNEFIRIPDYLAGTMADIALPSMDFTHDKFRPIFADVFVNSQNNALVEILGNREKITTRRIGFVPPSA